MTQPPTDPALRQLTADELSQLDAVCLEFESALAADPASDLTIYIGRLQPHLRPRACHELLVVEWHQRRERGETLDLATERARFPDFASAVESAWTDFHNPTTRTGQTSRPATNPSPNAHAHAHADTLDLGRAARPAVSHAAQLAELLARYQAELAAGSVPDHERWLSEHPEFAESLRRAMDGLDFLQTLRTGPNSQPTQLGDFRLLREIGRGGMGAVFEAEQISLRRHVALKVLWLNSVSDPESIRRFQREASTVAQLHHTNIVPIFSVGREANVNYYAMQLIDGESLDRTLRSRGGRIDPTTVAEWGLQAAEALAHAHQRGVIHRDVKPSNLMLDRHGQIWLTDFGLAKRSDDVTLSMAGAVMGTPRYMSPEQASASTRDVDHRTDIYSLGATLYELVTGQPVYDGQSPHVVISQILTSEPQAPRRVYSAVPRALETVLLKCLAKDPQRRYSTARALADDLRSFLDGRPISARPPHLLERSRLWFKRQRRSVSLAVMTALATASLIAIVTLAGYAYHASQLGTLALQSSQPGVSAELLDTAGRQALRPLTVPTQDPISLPAGQYTLRARVPGLLSQDYTMDVPARAATSLQLRPELQQLMPPLDSYFEYGVVHHSGAPADLIAYNAQELMIRTADQHHEVRLNLPLESLRSAATSPGFVWPPDRLNNFPQNLLDKCDLRLWIVPQGLDVDRDGTGDLVLAMRHQALVAVVSRKRGKVWSVGLSPDVRQPTDQAVGQPAANSSAPGSWLAIRSTIVEQPIVCGDVNGDEVPDLLVQLAHINATGQPELTQSVRAVTMLSGADGAELWRYDIPASLFQMPAAFEVPYEFRWFPGAVTGWSDGTTAENMLAGWQMMRVVRQPSRRSGNSICVANCRVRQTSREREVLVATPTHYVRLQLTTGKLLSDPQSWGVVVSEPVQTVDLNGDGSQEVLAVEDEVDPPSTTAGAVLSMLPRAAIVAWSVDNHAQLWRRSIRVNPPTGVAHVADRARWPVIADMNHDGAVELVLPTAVDEQSVYWNSTPAWGEVEVWDGATGDTRWTSRIRHADLQLNRLAVAPDVDADGWDEVLVASIWGMHRRASLFVDCLSGSSSRRIWSARWHLPEQPQSITAQVSSLLVWQAGVDGAPTVVAGVSAGDGSTSPGTNLALFSLRTGRLVHVGNDGERCATHDLDGDGVDDLWLRHYHRMSQGMREGTRLSVIRGVAGDTVRRLGSPLLAVTDLNGDGVEDFVQTGARSIVALSSADGRQLWRCSLPDRADSAQVTSGRRATGSGAGLGATTSEWDLDRDGVSDLLVHLNGTAELQRPLMAVSGRSGRVLWRAAMERRFQQGQPLMDCVDLDGDGTSELLYYGYSDWGHATDGPGFLATDGQLWCAVFRADTGQLIWKTPLTQLYGMIAGGGNTQVPYRFLDQRGRRFWVTDCNADGTRDVLVVGEVESPPEDRRLVRLEAHDGRDGRLLWRRPLSPGLSAETVFRESSRLEVCDLDGVGGDELVSLELVSGQPRQAQLTVRSASDGRTLWTWSRPVSDDFEQPTNSLPLMAWPRIMRLADGQTITAPATPADAATVDVAGASQPGSGVTAGRAAIGLVLRSPERRDVLWLVDARGQTWHEYPLERQSGEPWTTYRLWAADLNGDGTDELVVNNGQLTMLGVGAELRTIASFPVDVSDSMVDVRLWPASGNRRSEVLVLRTDRPVVRAFDAGTGAPSWSVSGPDRASMVLNDQVPSVDVLSHRGESADRAVLNLEGNLSLCRLASRAPRAAGSSTQSGSASPAVAEASSEGSAISGGAGVDAGEGATGVDSARNDEEVDDDGWTVIDSVVGEVDDPRLRRALPWSMELNRGDTRREVLWVLGMVGVLSLGLVMVPAAYVRRLVRGRWTLATWMMLPAVIGLSLVVLSWPMRMPLEFGPLTIGQKYGLALVASPVWLWLIGLTTSLRHGRWWRVLAWLAVAVLLSLLIGWLGVLIELDDAPLAPGETIDWSDWYWIGLWGFYLTALLHLIITSLSFPARWLFRRLFATVPIHPAGANA